MLPRFPSHNANDIPTLLVDHPGAGLPLPLIPWGATKRVSAQLGTWHFYVDDYRFRALWDNPDAPLRSGCKGVVEPNYSVTADTPRAEAVWRHYQKRALARYWQSEGLIVWVDLYSECDPELILAGVPIGYERFATVGVDVDQCERDLALARSRGHHAPLLLVYGGSLDVRQWCQANGAIHIPRWFANRHAKRVDSAHIEQSVV